MNGIMKVIKIMIAALILNLITTHYSNSRVKRKMSDIRLNIIKQKITLKHKQILLAKASHPERLTTLCKQYINYKPTTIEQFIR